MPVRSAEAHWEGTLQEGSGRMALGSGAFEGRYSFASRFEEGPGTNPEELLGAAHAGCFTMALTAALTRAGHSPTRVDTTARVHIERGESGFSITKVELSTEAEVPGLGAEDFAREAETAKANCPVSRALAGTQITLQARLT
ncbi:MAG TPA: OsmC family protein [Acidimicrobiales bacterium]|nr:OsmC family protein [Acidimicrobiales bacterium]